MKVKLPDKNKSIKTSVAVLMCVLVLLAMLGLSRLVYVDRAYVHPVEGYVDLTSGEPFSRTIKIEGTDPVLKSIGITFGTYNRYNSGDVKVELIEGDKVLYEWNIDAIDLRDNEWQFFEPDRAVRLSQNGVYTIRITDTYEEGNMIAVGVAATDELSCRLYTYDRGSGLKWFALMAVIAVIGFAVMALYGGLPELSVTRIVVLGIVAVLVVFTLGFEIFDSLKRTLNVKPAPAKPSEIIDVLAPGEQREYVFAYDGDPIDRLEIFTGGENISEYTMTLVNKTSGVTYFENVPANPEWRVEAERLCMLLSTRYSPSGVRYYENGEYSLTITNISSEKALNIELASEGSETSAPVIVFGGLRESRLGVKVATFSIVLMYAYVVVLSVFRKRKALTPERFFLITAVPLSVLYFIVMQPWNVPDCGAHFLASYRVSNFMMGINGDRSWFMRACDSAYYNGHSWWIEKKPDLQGISDMLEGLRAGVGDTSIADLTPHEVKMEYYSVINWLPQAIGFVIGRLMGLGATVTVLIARLLILAAYIGGCYRAVRNTPIGKSIFVMLALLPVSLMMSSSFSYDAMVIIVALNFMAIFLKLRKAITRGAVIEALIWAFLLGAVKGGSCLILLPVMLLLLKKDRKVILSVTGIIAAALLSVLIFDKLLPTDELFQFGEEHSKNMMTAFAFAHPVSYLQKVITTYLSFSDMYVNQAFGMYLSYIESTLDMVPVLGAPLAVLIFSTFEKDELELRRADRYVFVGLFLLALLITPAMLLSYTPIGSSMIFGIQGRYFFPVMVPLLLAVTKFGLRRSDGNADEKSHALAMNACLDTYVVFTIIMVYMMMKLYITR
ncbi:MAG: DUF2142 domain-containing protein [Clostridiales bacterium]|nr:DUF2142 domain-containing protein [Clostridiales bacterium]